MPRISIENLSDIDFTMGYKLSDEGGDVAGNYYYGYLNTEGQWYIRQSDATTGTYNFAKGDSDYTTNWYNRESLTYANYSEVF